MSDRYARISITEMWSEMVARLLQVCTGDVCVNKIQHVRPSRYKFHMLMEFRQYWLEIRMLEISGNNTVHQGVYSAIH